ncbi:TPA: hypothetical protein G9B55_003891 [Salmonella enterica]|uniref:Uncharacterized protein n=1 Tax=Salmonella enterica TaxID=28901 RepID=A0A744B0L0_SALER|nr:hypothetical protein [Salmonella enterica]
MIFAKPNGLAVLTSIYIHKNSSLLQRPNITAQQLIGLSAAVWFVQFIQSAVLHNILIKPSSMGACADLAGRERLLSGGRRIHQSSILSVCGFMSKHAIRD